jgi:Spy/CpxP family protein refolding chaperone
MMPRGTWLLLVGLAPGLAAQVPGDSGAAPPAPPNGAEARELRAEVRERWHAHVRSTLALSDDQAAQLAATEQRFEAERQPVRAQQRDITAALKAELSSGTPNEDRVKQLSSARQENQLKLQQLNRAEDHETQGYLTPVQHARYQEERRRFQERVAELVRHRREQQRPVRPAPRPAPRRHGRP